MNAQSVEAVRNDKFAAHVGIELVEVRPGWALASLRISDEHMNGVGVVQGGVIFTLADYAFAAAANAKGPVTLGLGGSISYFKPPRGSILTAEASEVSSSRRICCYNVDIFDEDHTLVARFNATGYVKAHA